MIKTLKAAWGNEDLRKRMLFTLLIVVAFRIGNVIPVPFVNTAALSAYFNSMSNTALGLLNVMSGGAFATATIFALSVQPYINASIIIQLLCVAIPSLEHLAKEEGEAGRKKIENITRWTAVGIGILQALAYYMMMKNYGLLATDAVGVWWKALIIIAVFAAGSVVIMLMGKAIDDHGIGNGISIILFAGIISRLPADIISTVTNVKTGNLKWWVAVLTYIGVLAIIALIVIMNDAEHRVPIMYAKRVVGRKQYNAHNTYLPLKLSMSGVMPIIFAQSIASLPATIAAFIGKTDAAWARTDTGWFVVGYTLMLFFFAYFYSSIQFNTIEIANNLKANGGVIPGYRPGKPTSELLQSILNRVTFLGALYLAVVVVVPMTLMNIFPSTKLTGLSLGGTSIIIAVGVAVQIIKDLEVKLMTRNYSGLFTETSAEASKKHDKEVKAKNKRNPFAVKKAG